MQGDDWKKDLGDFLNERKSKEEQREERAKQQAVDSEEFFRSVAAAALQEVKVELEKYGREVTVKTTPNSASIYVQFEGVVELDYMLKVREVLFTSRLDTRTKDGS
jgi:nucleosome binding factor SPN SPT16 subunit